MSLVVLRSWTDGPPKVRGIAPSDSNEKYVYVPDHRGQFVTQEVTKTEDEGGEKLKVNASDTRRQTWNGDGNPTDHDDDDDDNENNNATVKETIKIQTYNSSNYHHENNNEVLAVERRSSSIGADRINNGVSAADCKSSERHYKSLSHIDLHSEERDDNVKKTITMRNSWANETRKPALKPKPTMEHHQEASSRSTSTSPDHDYIHELESTPPASPMLNGRYRNLGPELAACIPKRQLKFSTNWLRDGPASIGYPWSQQRRSLSNSTPSLSQDFYSSEEEKISSFSSQSSSKTSSPQPAYSIRQLQRQFEQRNYHKEQEGRRIDEEVIRVGTTLSGSAAPWTDGSVKLTKVDRSSPLGGRNNNNNRRPRQRQLITSPSTPPPPPPDQHDYYRSLSNTSSTVSLDSFASINRDELDSPSKVRGLLGKQLSLSSEDETNESRGGSPGKSDVILVEVIRKKLKAKSTSTSNNNNDSSGFSASGSDSGSDKDSADSTSCHRIKPQSPLSMTGSKKPLKTILKKSSGILLNKRNEEVVSRKEKDDDVNVVATNSDVNEKLCELQLVGGPLTEPEQIEQNNDDDDKSEGERREGNKAPLSSSSPTQAVETLERDEIIRNRESEVFDSVIAPTSIDDERERKETEGVEAEIQEGNTTKGIQEEEEEKKSEGNAEAPQGLRTPVEIIPPASNKSTAQFPTSSSSSSSNSEQNPLLSALPNQQTYSLTTDDDDCIRGSNQSESIERHTATENASVSVIKSVPVVNSESNAEVASRLLDQVLTEAAKTLEEISSSSRTSVSEDTESLPMDRGKFFEERSSIASVKIPVQAVNKYVRSDSSDEFESEFIWRKSSVRESFRGFCQELLESSSSTTSSHEEALNNNCERKPVKPTEKIVIHVSQPQAEPQSLRPNQAINEGMIEFEEDDDNEPDHQQGDQQNASDLTGRAETPMQQCNNSIEYISVRDNVQVHNAAAINTRESIKTENSEPGCENGHCPNPQPIRWIVTLDLGSRSSGFSYWGHVDHNVVHIGSWSGDNCVHKIPSWILTTSEGKLPTAESNVKIGQEALDEYMEHGDSKCSFVNQWREFFQLDPEAAKLLTFPYTLDTADDEMEFTKLITSLVNFFGRAAVSQMGIKFGPAFDKDEHIEWLITVPSGWNTHSRQSIREAAYKSNVVKDTDGVNLIEEPIAAAVFAAMCSQYENVLAVDVGGAFMHLSGFTTTDQRRMVQTLDAQSLPLPTAESSFEQLLTQIVSREYMLYYKAKYKAGWVELLKNFERAKCKFDTSSSSNQNNNISGSTSSSTSAFIFFPSSFVTEFHSYTGMDLCECIQEQNGGITWNENGALRIPYDELKQILKPTVDFVLGKIDCALKLYDYDNIVLTGGCAKCKYLNESISTRFPGLRVILPKEFSSGVLQGATLSLMPNLEPKLLIKSPFSIGVGVMTPFDPNVHPEEKKIVKDGKTWCADVWDTLIRHGQDMEINSVINTRAYVGAQPGQSCLVLPLFKSSAPGVPKLVTDKSVLKCCELRFESTKTWHEIDLILTCRASELIVMAVDRENLVHRVVIDIL